MSAPDSSMITRSQHTFQNKKLFNDVSPLPPREPKVTDNCNCKCRRYVCQEDTESLNDNREEDYSSFYDNNLTYSTETTFEVDNKNFDSRASSPELKDSSFTQSIAQLEKFNHRSVTFQYAVPFQPIGSPNSLEKQCITTQPTFDKKSDPEVAEDLDSISDDRETDVAIDMPIDDPETNSDRLMEYFSWIYCMVLISLGVIIYVYNQLNNRQINEYFTIIIAVVGSLWLAFFQLDLHRYKRQMLQYMKLNHTIDNTSQASTECCFNGDHENASYRFLQGRHSGSMFLKIGMIVFWFGHMLNEGLQAFPLFQEIYYQSHWTSPCFRWSALFSHLIRQIYASYLLYITYKYSNIVINKHKSIARIGIIHVVATSLLFWFSSIIEDGVEDYKEKFIVAPIMSSMLGTNGTSIGDAAFGIDKCPAYHGAMTFLYPFSIEYNIIQAGIWILIYLKIGHLSETATPHHYKQKQSGDGEDLVFESNLVITADCHSANKGIFAGLGVLFLSVLTITLFFYTPISEGHEVVSKLIHTVQEGSITVVLLVCVAFCYYKLSHLNLQSHPIIFLDDLLLLIPMPFYYINLFLSIYAEFATGNYYRLAVLIIVFIQVTLQTPFIMDALKRCCNCPKIQYLKPGREVITFLIFCNIALWMINTFELRKVEEFYSQYDFFGKAVWMFVGHTTLPLMLFYRFHSAVCLADIWKSAYQKEHV